MKKLVILRGNSGSGKTIVAKKLQEKFGPNTMRLSHDMIRMEVLHVWAVSYTHLGRPRNCRCRFASL